MRVFRTSYKDRDGQTKTVARWYIELRDHLRTVRRFPAFTDRAQSEKLGRQIERLINYRVAGEQPDAALSRWLEQIPPKLCEHFGRIGLLDKSRAASGKSLAEHVQGFEKFLLIKGDTPKQARQQASRVRKIFKGCGFVTWSGISASKIQSYLALLREKGMGKKTSNAYLKAVKHFARWMVQDGRATASPVEYLKSLDIGSDDIRRIRRPLDLDEVRRLLERTAISETRLGMTGQERSLLYRLAIETGLRANELRSLRVSSFDFRKGTVTIKGSDAKNRHEATLPLKADTAAELQVLLAGKFPSARAFKVPGKPVDMFKSDLVAAGISYQDDAGRYCDFHSLRHTTGTLLAAVGVHPKTAQDLMRHSKIDLTMNIYTHTKLESRAAAIESLPDLSLPSSQSQRKTGTDNADVTTPNDLALCLALSGGKHRTNTDSCGKTNPIYDSKTGFLNEAEGARTLNLRIDSPTL